MTKYDKYDFERDFMLRTLEILKDYKGSRDATILINCLLGLIILPKETYLELIPDDSIDNIKDWGISPSSIVNIGDNTEANYDPNTIRGFVHNLRHSVAHFSVRPTQEEDVKGFEFTNSSRFKAKLSLDEITKFAGILTNYLIEHALNTRLE